MAIELVACGIDPGGATLFVQSHVPEHSELAWILATVAPYGETVADDLVQRKSERADYINCGLFTYPVLMAADIPAQKPPMFPSEKIRFSTWS